jgi:hypothetical protein
MWCAGGTVVALLGLPPPVHTARLAPALFTIAASVMIVFVAGSALGKERLLSFHNQSTLVRVFVEVRNPWEQLIAAHPD